MRMSFHEIAITIAAENRASAVFHEVSVDATRMNSELKSATVGFTEMERASEATAVSLRTTAMAIASIGMMGSMIISTAEDFGILDREAAKQMRTFVHLIAVVATIIRVKTYLMAVTNASTAAVAANTVAQNANTGGLISQSIAKVAYILKTSVATAVTWAFNASLAAKVTLLTLGVGAVVVAAAAMAALAMQTQAAASAVRDYNAAAAETPSYTRSITRAGEEDLRRRGIE